MSDEQTLRDTFAAAALTGIIASSDDSEIKRPQAEFLARQAWLVADAMLRERAATNHDAASAATARVDAAGISRQGTGDTPTFTLTEDERETLEILRIGIAAAAGNEDTAERRFAVDAIRVIDGILARLEVSK